MIAKQDKLLYINFTILLNLAEDFSIEKKMKKRYFTKNLLIRLIYFIFFLNNIKIFLKYTFISLIFTILYI